MKTRYFFLSPEDQKAGYERASKEHDLRFVSSWSSKSEIITVIDSWHDLPDLGITRTPRQLGAGWYLVFNGKPEFKIKSLETANGMTFKVDYTSVTNCLDLRPSGLVQDGSKIVVGSVTAGDDQASKKFFSSFLKLFFKYCEKDSIGDIWGPHARTLGAEAVR
jgi:hypothetical protein